jgi:hypothetical protein
VPVTTEGQETCPACGKRWIPAFTVPVAENARLYDPTEQR